MSTVHDFCVVGGGIIGLATAMALQQAQPGSSVVLCEKEAGLARHQTGHNSGVVHSGLYYEPGSLKATLCREGAAATFAFADEHGVAVRRLGKLVVATDERDAARLTALTERAVLNGVTAHPVSREQLTEMEPNVVGVRALHVPVTSSVDYPALCAAMEQVVTARGGEVRTGVAVTTITETTDEVRVATTGGDLLARRLVACAGLQADRVAALCGITGVDGVPLRIVPFRGEYYRLPTHRAGMVSHLIYPVPDPDLPFLGVHLTPMVDGRTTIGPNAVLGLAREGYRKGSIDGRDVREILGFPGFWRVARANIVTGAKEVAGSLSRRRYLALARRYCPSLELSDLLPEEAGIRAQAVDRHGKLLHDFAFGATARTLHVLNAPSPAATSAIPIGREIARRATA
ncbi:MAG: L-2-hydroxyglutarate oxidase [Mycobacteriaceae bacterium]